MNEEVAILEAEEKIDDQTLERLRRAADAAAAWEVIPRPPAATHFPRRVRAARKALEDLEECLARQSVSHVPHDPQLLARRSALLELGASHRMFRAAIRAVSDKPRRIAELPRLVPAPREDEPRVAGLARAYLRAVDGAFSAPAFRAFIELVQAREPLNVDELWSISAFLRFTLLEFLLEESRALLRSPGSASVPQLMAHIKSLRSITHADWVYLIEPFIGLDVLLRQDPAGIFEQMDFVTRELYRKRIARAARRSDYTEWQVAQAALALAQKGKEAAGSDPRIRRRQEHIGYYLVGEGYSQLAARIRFHPSFAERLRAFVRSDGENLFLSGIEVLTLLFIAAALFPVLPRIAGFTGLAAIIILVFIPATQDAVDFVNSAITSLFDPEPLPKLDFSTGIPAASTTLVAVPTLLLKEKQVRKLVNDLEVRYLANRDPNLHFALLTDLADSVTKPRSKDSHPLVDLAVRLINELNAKYQSCGGGAFLLLHRHRAYNMRQGVWMGWERKRGKLLDLNKLLGHDFDAFPIKAGPVGALEGVRYVLTLDSDSQLPRGEAARLAGAISHPLNQAVIDSRLRIVTRGFGILQPRVGVAVRSTARSRLASIYSGQGGFDIYTRATSDAYQDLFGEGIFTGKGIYEVTTLHAVLHGRFPRNSLLSHDLIEGAYARAGLAADIELVDDYPSHYSAYIRRKHRWVRGDWQIAQWMFSRVPDETGHWVKNPISSISRWKIFDNLRRSLVDPALFILFLAGWIRMPGGPLYWTIVPLLMLFFPAAAQFAFALWSSFSVNRKGQVGDAVEGLRQAMLIAIFRLAFLAHETLLAIDAIVRSLVRRFITGERLLEWETAAEAEQQSAARAPVDRYLGTTALVALVAGALVWRFSQQDWAILCALPILGLWALAEPIAKWLDRPPRKKRPLAMTERDFLMTHALRIWRYFYEFSSARHNYLIPDNVMEEGFREAARVSPTNIGLLLNSRQAACELGFLTPPEFAELTRRTLASIERMEKYRGHLYNWYDTETLCPLDRSPFVSSVDSGNLVASLHTLHAGSRSLAAEPLLAPGLFAGLRAHIRLLHADRHFAAISPMALPGPSADVATWIGWLAGAEAALASAAVSHTAEAPNGWWMRETSRRINALFELFRGYIPWVLPEFDPLRGLHQLDLDKKSFEFNCADALHFAERLQHTLESSFRALIADEAMGRAAERLLDLLPKAIENLHTLISDLQSIEEDAERLANQMEFGFLVDPYRQILSIGFEMGAGKRHDSCYDLIASEARIATFLAIARGDIRQQSWLKLGRDHTYAYGRFLLLSWSGTMFEYLMPALWMQAYPGTLIERTQDACVHVQRAFARRLGIPWGVSESASSRKNDRGDYHYFAYGIPRIALWFEATAGGPVISPYSSFLALTVDGPEAIGNLRRMGSAGWVGRYGFYESADYSASARGPALAKEWMAHHLGMSLLAITNLLRNNVVQRWFHEHPMIQATEMLLEEKPISKAVLRAQLKELAPIRRKAKSGPSWRARALKAAL